ncbi:FCH-domain-containing protein [Suhomyces tanzawaensis NRRL Y-17324]|uniref:Protein BZZ1 n=1 Tax=Suhomyces tanzawaensis NRRL Y-17324 TaxID=984487 RepID=A0A1E4SB95_9ASCO|nr:FCH-domain-containing protein [Suhomyces tanzawaensis NRRL Y-17324]ODV76745.1 FCH-domain-containing protein [Suhomyces tanzawaensis NRRL Y-17324]
MAEISIGNDLKDSFKPTSKWINNGINWLSDVEEFYRERAAIEKEYSTKLKELCKRHFDKKAKVSALVSVGDNPQVTPGSLESASLVLWTDVLTQTEAIAEEKNNFHRELNSKVGDNLVLLKSKTTQIAKQIERINEHLVSEKDKSEEEVNKAKKAYDSLCQVTEGVREKTEKSASEKYQRRLDEKTVDMNNGKNDYLIKINIANRLKDKYYYQDVPELLDYFQELNENRVGLVNKILKNAGIIERNSNDKCKEKLHLIDGTINQNEPKLDTAMYIKHNIVDWKEPSDFYFIPSSIWHDDEALVVKEPELTTLKKRLNERSIEYNKVEERCLDTKQKLEEATLARKLDPSELTLKFDGKLLTSLSILHTFMKQDGERVRNEVEIEVIQNFAGDKDLSYYEEARAKKSTFGFLRSKSKKGKPTGNGESDSQSIHTVKSANSHTPGMFSLRKKAHSILSGHSTDGGDTAKALYEYSATGDDEVSISAGDQLLVTGEDDGSGWTKVRLGDGSEGLVPSTYIEITRTGSGDKKKGPSVAPKRGAKRVQYVEALYDYQADGDDEITISAGDRIVLIQDDTDGSGWTEGELNGQRGMFPTSYVKKV